MPSAVSHAGWLAAFVGLALEAQAPPASAPPVEEPPAGRVEARRVPEGSTAGAGTLRAAPLDAPVEEFDFLGMLKAIRRRSPALGAARAAVQISEGEVSKAWTGWKPTVSAVGSVQVNNIEAKLDQGAFIRGIADALGVMLPPMLTLPEPTVVQPRLQVAGVLQLSQNLFNITVLRAPEVAKAARQASIAQLDAVEDELLFQGATLYATVVGLDGLEAAAERALTVAEKRIKDAEAQLEAGTATPLAVTRARTDLATAQNQRTQVRAQKQKLLASLAVLTGTENEVAIKKSAVLAEVSGVEGDWQSRTSIRAKAAELDAATKAIGLVNMNWLPSLQLRGQAQYLNFEGFAGNNLTANVSLNLLLPLYDGGQRYADTRIAQARASAARQGLEQARLEAQAFLRQARADLDAATAEVSQTEAQLQLASEVVRQAEELVKGGLSTALELADADARRFQADQLLAQKRLALDLAALRVSYAGGVRLARLAE
jgi:outer membrane protein